MEELLHPLLKVPFEKANKSFRLFHKHVSRELAAVQKAVVMLQADQAPAQHARVADTIESLENIADRIRNIQHDAKQFISEQQKDVNSCVLRAQYVQKYKDSNDVLAASAHAATRPVNEAAHATDLIANTEQQSLEYDRLIADYLLSHGYIKSSKFIQETKGVEFVVDHDLHLQCRVILNDLDAHNVSTAITWCSENGSRLRRLQSQLEFRLRLQEFLELVRSDKKLEAIQYAQAHLTPLSMQNEDENARKIMMEAIQEAMATLAYKSPDQCGVESYSRLFSIERWQSLKIAFRSTFCEVYGILNPSALSIALQAGLSSLNTRTCRRYREAAALKRARSYSEEKNNEENGEDSFEARSSVRCDASDHKRQSDGSPSKKSKKSKLITVGDLMSKPTDDTTNVHLRAKDCGDGDYEAVPPLCPACSVIGGALCEGLPYAHHPHSRLVCRITQSVMDEHNPPVALPNGYVYSKRAIEMLTSHAIDSAAQEPGVVSSSSTSPVTITCPVTQDIYSTSVLKPVYIL